MSDATSPAPRGLGPARLVRETDQFIRQIGQPLIWSNIEAGRIELRGQPLVFQVAAGLGLGLVTVLLPLGSMPTGERVITFVPVLVVPLAYGVAALAWAYILTGSCGMPGPLRGLILALFGISVLDLIEAADVAVPQTRGWILLAVGALALLAIVVGGGQRWLQDQRGQQSIGLCFPIVLVLCGTTLLASYLAAEQEAIGTTLVGERSALRLTVHLSLLRAFLVPFLYIAGSMVATAAVDVSNVGTRWVMHRIPVRLWAWGLAAFLVIRIGWTWVRPLWEGEPRTISMGALTAVILVGIGYLALRRWITLEAGDPPAWAPVVPALVGVGPVPFVSSFLTVAGWVSTYYSLVTAKYEVFQHFGLVQEQLIQATLLVAAPYARVAAVAFVVAAVAGWIWRRFTLPQWSLVLLCVGGWMLLWEETRPLRWLEKWQFDTADFDGVGTVGVGMLLVYLWVRRRLTPGWLAHLSMAALILWLLEAYDFLSDPFTPLHAIPGMGSLFLAISLLVSISQMGGYFGLTGDSRSFPRWSRSFLFLGYALMAALFAHWDTIVHRAGAGEGYAETGFVLLGMPLAIMALLTLRSAVDSERETHAASLTG